MDNLKSIPSIGFNFRGRYRQPDGLWIMGILNITPDSISDGGAYVTTESAVARARQLLAEGADILDIGGASSRPGATEVPAETEWERVDPVIRALRQEFPEAILSLDTWRASVARQGLALGVDMINDISAGTLEPEILNVTAEAGAPYLLMHMAGTPQTMQENPRYNQVTREVLEYLMQRTQAAREAGIRDVMADPGFGFGKTMEHNYTLLRDLSVFVSTGVPVGIGISRKSMIRTMAGESGSVSDLSAILHYQAIQAGVQLIRVHDPAPVFQARKLYRFIQSLPQ